MRLLIVSVALLGLLILVSPAQAGQIQVTVINNTKLSIAIELTPGANTNGGGVTNLDAGGSIVFNLLTPMSGTDNSVLRFGSGNGAQTTVTITSTSAVAIGYYGVEDVSYSVSLDGELSCVPNVSTEVKDYSSLRTPGQTVTTYGTATVHITKCGSTN